jgi:hypothetical protein
LEGDIADMSFLTSITGLERILLQENPGLTGELPEWLVGFQPLGTGCLGHRHHRQ